ncbi:MAG: hypothetical protein QOE73_165 [Verrucomicrobiota bacterium]|jgi:hypothetical protein
MIAGKLKKDQIQKLALSAMGFVILLYVYFSFFLGPLNRSRSATLSKINDRQAQLSASKGDISKATNLEKQAAKATVRFKALKDLSPEGAPIAWFPPRIKGFFANQQIDKAFARLESSSTFKQTELAEWSKVNWVIDLPQADFVTLGTAIAELENSEPLLAITKIKIQTLPDQPQFQQVTLTASTTMQKR